MTRWVLKWTFTDGHGHVLPQRTQDIPPHDDPQAAYRRKLGANKYLLSGAKITNVRLYRVEEVWTQVQPDPPSIYEDDQTA